MSVTVKQAAVTTTAVPIAVGFGLGASRASVSITTVGTAGHNFFLGTSSGVTTANGYAVPPNYTLTVQLAANDTLWVISDATGGTVSSMVTY